METATWIMAICSIIALIISIKTRSEFKSIKTQINVKGPVLKDCTSFGNGGEGFKLGSDTK